MNDIDDDRQDRWSESESEGVMEFEDSNVTSDAIYSHRLLKCGDHGDFTCDSVIVDSATDDSSNSAFAMTTAMSMNSNNPMEYIAHHHNYYPSTNDNTSSFLPSSSSYPNSSLPSPLRPSSFSSSNLGSFSSYHGSFSSDSMSE